MGNLQASLQQDDQAQKDTNTTQHKQSSSASPHRDSKLAPVKRGTFSHVEELKSTFHGSQVLQHNFDESWRLPSKLFNNNHHSDRPPLFKGAFPKQQTVNLESFGASTIPMWTVDSQQNHKTIHVYVDKEIEFTLPIMNEHQMTCGWLLSEVTRRYLDALTVIKQSQERGVIKKYTRKMIVALKTTDQRESLDYWLTQYDRTLEILQDGDFLIAHFAKLRDHRILGEVCKEYFEQIKIIGRGGFSRVVLARKKDTGRLYALKIMKKVRIFREKKLKPILSERSILEQLSTKHPFIIKLHWAFQSADELFFVMDVCTGGELFYHLSKHKKLSESAAKFYFAEILLGLEHLHQLNIVYRDIKPENILLDIDGHIRIADFGLSKIILPSQRSYSFCGSPEYMSPEMLACVGHDKRLDIYCLGALLFEMVTGLPPFYNRDVQSMYESIMQEEVTLPNDIPHREVIGDLISKMMMKDPAKRYQTLIEVKKHLWLKDIRWDDIINKRVKPPIIPNVRESHIDPDYTELPLDFEEEEVVTKQGRMTTDRRHSYFYESTLQSKRSVMPGIEHHQSFFNQFFEKNDSVCSNSAKANVASVPFQRSGLMVATVLTAHGASIQSDNSQGLLENAPQQQYIPQVIENFTFVDVPKEEFEVLQQLNGHKNHQTIKKRHVLQPPMIVHRRERTESVQGSPHLVSIQQRPSVEMQRAANQQDSHQEIFIEEINSRNQTGSATINENQQVLTGALINGTSAVANGPAIQQNNSNGSIITFYDESNQSIAQEFRIDESIAQVIPSGQPVTVGAILEVTTEEALNMFGNTNEYGTQESKKDENQRMTIEEEEDDDSLKNEEDLRSDFSSSQNHYTKDDLKRTIDHKSALSPIQIESKLQNKLQLRIQLNPQLSALRESSTYQRADMKPEIPKIMSSTFSIRTPTIFKNEHKSSSTIISPKFSMTAQTPSKPSAAVQSGRNTLTSFSKKSQSTTVNKLPSSATVGQTQGRKTFQSLSKNSRITTQQLEGKMNSQGMSVRESFTKDKPFQSGNSSELCVVVPPKLLRTQFFKEEAKSPRKQAKPTSQAIKPKIGGGGILTADHTARSKPKTMMMTGVLYKTHSSSLSSQSRGNLNKQKAIPLSQTMKSFLKQQNPKVKQQMEPTPSDMQVPTTTENNQDEDEYRGDEYQNEGSRSLKIKSMEMMMTSGTPHGSRGTNKTHKSIAQYQSFQRLLFQGGNPRHYMAGSDLGVGEFEKAAMINYTTGKPYSTVNPGNQFKNNIKSDNLKGPNKSADKSSLVMSGTAPTHNLHSLQSPHSKQTPDRKLETSFDKGHPVILFLESQEYNKQNNKVFQTPKSSISSKLFVNHNSVVRRGGGNGVPATQSQLNINVITRNKSSRNTGNAMKANTAKAIINGKI